MVAVMFESPLLSTSTSVKALPILTALVVSLSVTAVPVPAGLLSAEAAEASVV